MLRTIEAKSEAELTENRPIGVDLIATMELEAISSAYEALMNEPENERTEFYSVGHAVKRYTLDSYEISSLLDHRGRKAGVSMIATFLPREVVESLYTTMDQIGLNVSGITLEPIAAMNAVIPEDIRKLNLALVDIGAGTSDIALCDKGTVSAYTMATTAGDEVTEALMQALLVDFQCAERIKKSLGNKDEKRICYDDILGLSHELGGRKRSA